MTLHQRGLVELQGEDADISINGKSMKAWMEKALPILQSQAEKIETAAKEAKSSKKK